MSKQTKAWRVTLSKETTEHRPTGMRTACALHPCFTVYSKTEKGALGQVRQLVGPDGRDRDGISHKFNITIAEEGGAE
tara:strand:+ start:940 stop:1173 length:234 start_codon:yes stop_codon:yes gene_type:complete